MKVFPVNPAVFLGLTFALSSAIVRAVPITGTIGFSGPYVANNSNLAAASQIAFSNVPTTQVVTDGASSGSFSGIAMGTPVAMFTPLVINQPGIILPNTPIWSVGGFSLVATSLVELFNNSNVIVLEAIGTLTSTNAAFDATPGSWIATFNAATSGTVTNFTFSASSAANPPGVPDEGTSVALLSLALVSLRCFARRQPGQQ